MRHSNSNCYFGNHVLNEDSHSISMKMPLNLIVRQPGKLAPAANQLLQRALAGRLFPRNVSRYVSHGQIRWIELTQFFGDRHKSIRNYTSIIRVPSMRCMTTNHTPCFDLSTYERVFFSCVFSCLVDASFFLCVVFTE